MIITIFIQSEIIFTHAISMNVYSVMNKATALETLKLIKIRNCIRKGVEEDKKKA